MKLIRRKYISISEVISLSYRTKRIKRRVTVWKKFFKCCVSKRKRKGERKTERG
jgi:hypothetical protein